MLKFSFPKIKTQFEPTRALLKLQRCKYFNYNI